MNKLKILIIDDEPLAQQILEDYCAKIDYVEVTGKYFDALSALNHLHEHPVDALLLDIQMPDITGVELLDMLNSGAPKVLLTTASTEYAVKGFDYDNVVDYLHKPIKFSRFLKGIERLKKLISLEQDFFTRNYTASVEAQTGQQTLTIRDSKVAYKIEFDDIVFAQSWGNYLKIFLANDEMRLVRKTISELENELPADLFERIHKSYLVNIRKVKSIEGSQVRINGHNLPIGKSYLMSAKRRILGA